MPSFTRLVCQDQENAEVLEHGTLGYHLQVKYTTHSYGGGQVKDKTLE